MYSKIENREYNVVVPYSQENKIYFGRVHSIIIYLQLLQNKIVSGYTNEYIFGVVQ